ncbi:MULTISPECIES: class I SAM-dependent rRNA methyltransferase [Paenibacillus]|uniref:rRNA large subunit methyltransferase I n=1 Tax=Paenibacillus campinasensis TaxID=66347 RepID=A0A268F4K9_9BACL|nr:MULTISPECIES: class I SAM-dependent rRNA methyltransferase [Paenibacillus]PAD80316.1 rRNA large subunit methyltransferase I [Paenibacillus campinasensis]PAK55299.1 rRNA large subunit methyltransferase I [Paenibacillus sp. 7541]
MPSVILDRSRKKRLEQGHPWIFKSEIASVEGEPAAGELVQVLNHQGRFLAAGYYNPASQITVRVVSYEPIEQMDQAFFAERFRQCMSHRERFVQGENAYRLVYGEADFLPGLIVDRFADVLVIQLLTLGMDRCRDEIVSALVEVVNPTGIYERSDVSVRELEGLEQRKGPLYGECPRHVTVTENGLKIKVDIVEGQKTGYFFDQRENRASIKPLMTGWGKRSGITLQEIEADGQKKRVPVNKSGKEVTFPFWDGATVLECFSHTGSFTLHACQYGAKKVTCLDISQHAIDSARENVELNGFQERVEFVVDDAFVYLRNQVKGLEEREQRARADQKVDTSKPLTAGGGRSWDVVILDPPAFAKTKSAVKGACRGYKDINLHGMKLVNEGGYLVTASCSYHMRPDLFLETIQEAAQDAGKVLRLVEWRAAGKDHPQILGVQEGHYLKFAIFEVRSKLKI